MVRKSCTVFSTSSNTITITKPVQKYYERTQAQPYYLNVKNTSDNRYTYQLWEYQYAKCKMLSVICCISVSNKNWTYGVFLFQLVDTYHPLKYLPFPNSIFLGYTITFLTKYENCWFIFPNICCLVPVYMYSLIWVKMANLIYRFIFVLVWFLFQKTK